MFDHLLKQVNSTLVRSYLGLEIGNIIRQQSGSSYWQFSWKPRNLGWSLEQLGDACFVEDPFLDEFKALQPSTFFR